MSVGVMEDYKLRDLRVSHTLGSSSPHVGRYLQVQVYFQKNKKRRKHYRKVYFQQNKKRRKPKVKIVTLQPCEVKKTRYNFYEKIPTCAT